jgi:hypothetical protein
MSRCDLDLDALSKTRESPHVIVTPSPQDLSSTPRQQRRKVKLLRVVLLSVLGVSSLASSQGIRWSVGVAETNDWTGHNHPEQTDKDVSMDMPSNNIPQNAEFTGNRTSYSNIHSTISTPVTHNKTTLSACLLIKDDNDILPEWIAYHFHVLNLRTLIVAVDPSSRTSPSSIFSLWRQEPWNMNILEWTDVDYLPDYFLQGHFDKVPGYVPHTASTSVWHQHPHNMTIEEVEADLQLINNHRFRQATFVSRCFRKLKQQEQQPSENLTHLWALHIDTDEYVVLNPKLRERPNAVAGVALPTTPSAGSLLQFLADMYEVWPKRLLNSCLTMPRLLFGSIENTTAGMVLPSVPLVRQEGNHPDAFRFETLRWTIHAGFDDTISGLPKTMVNVLTLPDDHPIFVEDRIKSVHRPLESSYPKHKQICERLRLPSVKQWEAVRLHPLSIQHYVGSEERYFSRKDVRRNVQNYREKANVNGGVDDGWIQRWWPSFVDTYGIEQATKVMMFRDNNSL